MLLSLICKFCHGGDGGLGGTGAGVIASCKYGTHTIGGAQHTPRIQTTGALGSGGVKSDDILTKELINYL